MYLIDHHTGERFDISNVDEARKYAADRKKHFEARNQLPFYSVYDSETVVLRVVDGKDLPAGPAPLGPRVDDLEKKLADLSAAYGVLQGKLENFEADTGSRIQAMELRLESLEGDAPVKKENAPVNKTK